MSSSLNLQPQSRQLTTWIGSDATIMPGVTIGDGAIIAGGANVVKDVEARTVVGDNPAQLIRRLD